MAAADAFRQALEEGDFVALRRRWTELFPGMPQPTSDGEAEISMHMARTACASVSLNARAWSHRWLVDHDLPSQLPDDLKPKAERIYPRIVKAVGIAVKMPAAFREVGLEVRRAMAEAVEILAADGVDLDDREQVQGYMFEARARTLKQMLGASAARRAEA